MPLQPGNSREVVSSNIREMRRSGHTQKQAVAASLDNARRHPQRRDLGGGVADYQGQDHDAMGANGGVADWSKQQQSQDKTGSPDGISDNRADWASGILSLVGMGQPHKPTTVIIPQSGPQKSLSSHASGGATPEHHDYGGDISLSEGTPWWVRSEAAHINRSGLLSGASAGRADAVKTNAPSGAYIIPADVVSGLGEGNTLNGAKILDEVLRSGPYGTPLERISRGPGPPRAPSLPASDTSMEPISRGGGVGNESAPRGHVPVLLSHGEYQVSVPDVTRIGGGNLKKGHKILDKLVLALRKKHIQKLKSLKGPVRT